MLDFTPTRQNMKFQPGDGFSFPVTVTDDGAPFDLTGATLNLCIEDSEGTEILNIDAVIDTPTDGRGVFTVTTVQTAAIAVGAYEHEIRLTSPTQSQGLFFGTVSVVDVK